MDAQSMLQRVQKLQERLGHTQDSRKVSYITTVNAEILKLIVERIACPTSTGAFMNVY